MIATASDQQSDSAARDTHRPFIRGEGLHLEFDGGRTRALDGLDFHVDRNEFVAVTGPSGCGKSSLMNLIGLLDVPTAGTLHLGDQAYAQIKDAAQFRRRHIGFVFQQFNLLATLTAIENVLIPTIGVPNRRWDALEHAWQLMSDMGIERHAESYPAQLSGGERQRVAIARALINAPDIIIADEPTGSLDTASAEQVLALLLRLRAKTETTVILVTHDPGVCALADRVIRLRDGRLDLNSPR